MMNGDIIEMRMGRGVVSRRKRGTSRKRSVVYKFSERRKHVEVKEVSLLREVLEIQSHSRQTERMTKYLMQKAYALGADTVEIHQGNVYVTKGNTLWYPCIVAHTDTVHSIVPDDEYMVAFTKGKYFAWNPKKNVEQGVGGDDKVGIYVALAALRDFEHIKMAFFRDEEVGCQGARLAKEDFFKDVRYVLECDRRGNDDFVYDIGGPLQSKAFKKAVSPILQKHGYKFSLGIMTDIDELKDIVPVCMANMSCGYYNPHSSKEFVDVVDVERARSLVYDIFQTLDAKRWDHTVRGKFRSVYYGNSYEDWDYSSWYNESTGSHSGWRNQTNPKEKESEKSDSIIRIIERSSAIAIPETIPLPGVNEKEGVIFDKSQNNGPGVYEVVGFFDVLIEPTTKFIREQIQLPSHITCSLVENEENIIMASIEIELGVKDFDSLVDAENWGENESQLLSTKYELFPSGVQAYRAASNSVVAPY